jgi:lysozyme family protein
MSFETAFAFVSNEEAGYADWLKDKGGETYRGITRVSFPKWEGWAIIDSVKTEILDQHGQLNVHAKKFWSLMTAKLKTMPGINRLVVDFYKTTLYDRVKSWGYHQVITDKMFDIIVNIGPGSGHKIFQRAINQLTPKAVNVDGIIGPLTMAAAKKLDPNAFVKAIAIEQANHYKTKTIPYYGESTRKAFLKRAAWIPKNDDIS